MGDKGERVQFFSGKLTVAFWNLDDCPVPNNTDVKPIYDDIESALYLMGFVGVKEIVLHCEKVKYDADVFFQTQKVVYLPEGAKADESVLSGVDISYHILMNVEYSDGDHCNVAVISKKPSDELLRVLRCLKSRGHNALLIEPPDGLFSLSSLFDNAQLLGGGKPIHKAVVTYEDQLEAKLDCGPHSFPNEEEVYSSRSTEMIDFSERAKHVIGQRTVVFWDAVDSPFPLCFSSSSPDVIFKKISKTLIKKGFSRKISIWAYVDNDSELLARKKTWPSKIYFLPGGNSRRIRMLNDVMLLSRDSPPHEASLILVSGQFKGDPPYMTLLRDMDSIHYYLVLVTPREQPDDPNVWPGLLLDRAYLLRS